MSLAWMSDLLDATGFVTRGDCGPWSESLQRTYIASNAFTALACTLIAFGLYLLWRKRCQDIHHAGILLGFVAFIAACGLTHVCDITVFWWPTYRLYTLIDLITAIISVATAIVFPWVVHIAL